MTRKVSLSFPNFNHVCTTKSSIFLLFSYTTESGYGSKKKKKNGKNKSLPAKPKVTGAFGEEKDSGKPSAAVVAKVDEMRRELLAKIDSVGERLPPNALDQLIDELGGPDDVAEVNLLMLT